MASYFIRNSKGIISKHKNVSEVQALTQEILRSKEFKDRSARLKADATKITTFSAEHLQDNRVILSFYGNEDKVYSFNAWTYKQAPTNPEEKYFYDAALFFLGLEENRPAKPSSDPQSPSPSPTNTNSGSHAGQPSSLHPAAPPNTPPPRSNCSSSTSSSSSSAASSTSSSSSNSAQIDQAIDSRIKTLEEELAQARSQIESLKAQIAQQNTGPEQSPLPLSPPPNLSSQNIDPFSSSPAPLANLESSLNQQMEIDELNLCASSSSAAATNLYPKRNRRRAQQTQTTRFLEIISQQQQQIKELQQCLIQFVLHAAQYAEALRKTRRQISNRKRMGSLNSQQTFNSPTSSSCGSSLSSRTSCSSSEAANSVNTAAPIPRIQQNGSETTQTPYLEDLSQSEPPIDDKFTSSSSSSSSAAIANSSTPTLSQKEQIECLEQLCLQKEQEMTQLEQALSRLEQAVKSISEDEPIIVPNYETTSSSSSSSSAASSSITLEQQISYITRALPRIIHTKNQKIAHSEERLKDLEIALERAQKLESNTQSELESLTEETSRLRETIQHRENILREHIKTLKKDLAASKEQAIQNQSELDDAALQGKELEENIKKLQQELHSLQQQNKTEIEEREKQITELANLLEKTQSQQEEFAKKIVEDAKTAKTAIKRNQETIEGYQREIALLDKKLKDAENDKTKLTGQIASYGEQISQLEQHRRNLERALREASQELSALKIEKTSHLAELKDLRMQIQTKTQEVYNLQKAQRDFARQIEALKADLKKTQQESGQANQHRTNLAAELQKVTGILKTTVQEKNQLLQDVQAHKEHIERLTSRIAEQTELYNRTRAQLLQEQEIAGKKLNEAEAENSSLKARITEIEELTKLHGNQIAAYEAKIESYLKEREGLLAKIKQLETQLAANAQNQKNLQAKNGSSVQSLSAQRAMLNQKVNVTSRLGPRLKKYFNRTKDESSSDSEEASSTTSSSSAAAAEQLRQKEITTLREENAKLLQTKLEIEKQLKSLTEKLKSVEEQLASASRENTRLQEHYREEFSRSSSALLMQEQSSKEETENLKAEMEALKQRWDIQQSVIQDLKELLAKAMSKNEPEESESELEPTSTSSSVAASSQPIAPASTSSSNSSNAQPAQNAPAEELTQAPQTFSLWEGSLILPSKGTNRSLLGMARSIAKSIRK